jgi:hypothetical protein
LISLDERDVLGELASKVAKIATGQAMKQSCLLWKRHNMLRRVSCSPWVEITKGCRIAREEVEREERR